MLDIMAFAQNLALLFAYVFVTMAWNFVEFTKENTNVVKHNLRTYVKSGIFDARLSR